jgi:hypothetical protein
LQIATPFEATGAQTRSEKRRVSSSKFSSHTGSAFVVQ